MHHSFPSRHKSLAKRLHLVPQKQTGHWYRPPPFHDESPPPHHLLLSPTLTKALLPAIMIPWTRLFSIWSIFGNESFIVTKSSSLFSKMLYHCLFLLLVWKLTPKIFQWLSSILNWELYCVLSWKILDNWFEMFHNIINYIKRMGWLWSMQNQLYSILLL